MSIINIINQLEVTSSRNEKIEILKRNKDNEDLKRAIKLALDPFILFYIKKIPNHIPGTGDMSLSYAMDCLSMLSDRIYTGNQAIEHLTNILEKVSVDDAKVIKRIIEKDLKCGVAESTVNKVWDNLIPEYPCMLSSPYEEKLISKMQWPAIAQLKADGMRFNAIVTKDNVTFRSRNGKEIDVQSNLLKAAFLNLSLCCEALDGVVFDGELVVVDESGKILDRKTGNGILNKAVKGTQSKDEGMMVRAIIWDIIPLKDFHDEKSTWVYGLRLHYLYNAHDEFKFQHRHLSHFIDIIETTYVENIYEAHKLANDYINKGHEGIILKCGTSIWENKRSKQHIKFKAELECELRIIGLEECTGKNVGKLGAFNCQSEDGIINVSVGTGFSDKDREELYDQKLIGKIVTVKYNARITEKKEGKESLFLPVFVEIREDKIIANTSKEIK